VNSLLHFLTIDRGGQEGASGSEVLGDGTIGRKESLDLFWRLQPLHPPLSLADGLMRVLRSVVQIAVLPMFDARKNLLLRRAIATQFIGHDDPWDVLAPFQELAKESLGGLFIAPALHENIEDISLLIHCPPERVALALDRQKHLIQTPLIAGARAPTMQLLRVRLTKLATLFADRLIRHHDTAGKQQLFNIPIAEAKPVVQPYTMANDLDRKAVIPLAVGWGWCVHTTSMSHLREFNKLISLHQAIDGVRLQQAQAFSERWCACVACGSSRASAPKPTRC